MIKYLMELVVLCLKEKYTCWSSFEMVGEYFQWLRSDIMTVCFDKYPYKFCYSFDGKLNYIGDSNYKHVGSGLAKYKEGLLTVGD